MNLYRVTCRGMQDGHGTAYVVADDSQRAYQMLRDHLDARDLGFKKERELHMIELLAEQDAYKERVLFIDDPEQP